MGLTSHFGGKSTSKRPNFLADEVRTGRNNIKYMFHSFIILSDGEE